MRKIVIVLLTIMFTATAAAQNDTTKEKRDRVEAELQNGKGNGPSEIKSNSVEVPTKPSATIETLNAPNTEVQKPYKRFGTNRNRKPTTDEINARTAQKSNTLLRSTATNTTTKKGTKGTTKAKK